MRENKPDNNDDPRSPNNNDRFLEGTHVMLHGFSTKGPHYNGLFGVVASASKDGWHKVTLGPPHGRHEHVSGSPFRVHVTSGLVQGLVCKIPMLCVAVTEGVVADPKLNFMGTVAVAFVAGLVMATVQAFV